MRKPNPEAGALIELGLLFPPAIPALTWLFPLLRNAGAGGEGGITSLILVHGVYDLLIAEAYSPIGLDSIGQLQSLHIGNAWALVTGDMLLTGLILFLWKSPD